MFPPWKHFEYTYDECYNNTTNNDKNITIYVFVLHLRNSLKNFNSIGDIIV